MLLEGKPRLLDRLQEDKPHHLDTLLLGVLGKLLLEGVRLHEVRGILEEARTLLEEVRILLVGTHSEGVHNQRVEGHSPKEVAHTPQEAGHSLEGVHPWEGNRQEVVRSLEGVDPWEGSRQEVVRSLGVGIQRVAADSLSQGADRPLRVAGREVEPFFIIDLRCCLKSSEGV